uniref:Aminomethyltransferase n=1 Tax=candidate division WOR-3 bacterium TaxID=2052148 RepID=A0A7C4UGI4_UNCW3
MLKRTPFYNKHKELGAKIVPFAGFEMPVYYKSIVEEVLAVRKNVGIFDVSHMGEIEIRGKDRIKFTEYITTNLVSSLNEFQVQYSTMLYPDGGIVDDLLVYNLPDYVLLVVNASNTEKDYNWILENKKWDVEIINKSDDIFQVAIQGPRSEELVQKFVDIQLKDMKYYWSGFFNSHNEKMLISRTGYTGEDGFEIYGNKDLAEYLWNTIFEIGKDFDLQPAGLGARDTLRLEMKYCLYGNDIDEKTNPLEAGLGWVVKFDKDFIGKDSLLKIKEGGIKRKLTCIELEGKMIARKGYNILCDGKNVGVITSGNWSPSIEKSIAMGYIDVNFAEIGKNVDVEIKGNKVKGTIVKPPFYKKGTHK